MQQFHLAIPVNDLDAAREFYCGLLGCPVGRTSSRWVDLNFYGHQLTLHLTQRENVAAACNEVDSEQVPVRHFGAILEPGAWEALRDRLTAARTEFLIKPTLRFKGLPGEQQTMFLRDPSGNALEFKSFEDPDYVFRRD